MATLSTWPNPENLPRCFTLVRWLHTNGISWSGTATELVAQLQRDYDAAPAFPDSEELLAFLESNEETLRQLGLESSVQRLPGRPRLINLRIVNEPVRSQAQGPVEVPSLLPELKLSLEESQQPAPAVDEHQPDPPPTSTTIEAAQPSEPVTRLYTLLGLSPEDAIRDERIVASDDESKRAGFGEWIGSEESLLRRWLPLAIVVAISIVLAVAVVALVRRGNETAPAAPTISTVEAPVPVFNRDPNEVKRTTELLQHAPTTRSATLQYELALRYRDGLGVERNYASALTWLNLAKANGSARAQNEIRNLTPSVSPEDAQKARIAIGKAFMTGISVPRSYVIAHNWFSVAELAGSSEAAALKKQIESKMSEAQLQRARGSAR